MLTGVIGLFIVVACAATLHVNAITINDASDAAGALRPLAGHLAATLFGLGFLGAALLAACIPLSTAYSVAEAFRRPGDINDSFAKARLFYVSYGETRVSATCPRATGFYASRSAGPSGPGAPSHARRWGMTDLTGTDPPRA